MDFLPNIGPLDAVKSKWAWYYLMAGLASWMFIQYEYVEAGRNYWRGFGAPGDLMNAGDQFMTQVQQVVFWPVALVQTLNSQGIAV